MRDCLFLVADKDMEGMLKGFFGRDRFHLSLNCGPFQFQAGQDLLVAHGLNDPGLYGRANELLKSYRGTHRHAVVMLDAQWDGSPGAETIRGRIQAHLLDAGWLENDACAVVIDPELESWVWQENPHICSALGYGQEFSRLRGELASRNFWPAEAAKPPNPKEAMEWVLRTARKPRSSSIYQQMAARVSVKGCTDPAFLSLLAALRRWFPGRSPDNAACRQEN